MLLARQQREDVVRPSVVLPAYGCPDLVAAAVYAGLQPILVDVGADDPGYNLELLESAIDDDVVAVVAVNFLGIKERLQEIRALLSRRGRALLIEDNAQWFPEPLEAPGLVGDFVVLSFGRGKPVNMLGGGGLLIRNEAHVARLTKIGQPATNGLHTLKGRIFNLTVTRHGYWMLNRNPLISIGRTVYKPLDAICSMDSARCSHLGSSVRAYLDKGRAAEGMWRNAVAGRQAFSSIVSDPLRHGRLLRFPVLCSSNDVRERAVASLNSAGLGATSMYVTSLIMIDGVKQRAKPFGDLLGSERLASRLMTLPTHASLTESDVARAAEILASID
jgi:dTDP-4-amino-4,6-dideoxygalactose transaminase